MAKGKRFRWTHPADSPHYTREDGKVIYVGAVPKWRPARVIAQDPNDDPLSNVQRDVYLVMKQAVDNTRTTDGKVALPRLYSGSYQTLQQNTGWSRSAIKRAIRGLLRKHCIAPWKDGKEFVPGPNDAPTGRYRGDGGHKITTYLLLDYDEVAARRLKDPTIQTFIYKKTGKPHWFTLGGYQSKRFVTPQEAGNGPRGWNIQPYFDEIADRADQKELREDERNAAAVGEPPAYPDAPLPEESPAATEAGSFSPPPPPAAPRGDPPKPVWDAVTKYSAANKPNVWEIIDAAVEAAAPHGCIEPEEIADFVHECARLAKKKEVSVYRYFVKAVPDRILQDPPYKRRPKIERSEQTGRARCRQEFYPLVASDDETERIEIAAQWYAVRQLNENTAASWQHCMQLISRYERDEAMKRGQRMIDDGYLEHIEESA